MILLFFLLLILIAFSGFVIGAKNTEGIYKKEEAIRLPLLRLILLLL